MTIEQIITALGMTEAELTFAFTLLKVLAGTGRTVQEVASDIQYLFGFASIRRLELAKEVAQTNQSQAYAEAENAIQAIQTQINTLREQMKSM